MARFGQGSVMNEESAPSGPTRLPPLDPEMRSAIARRLLFCRTYRQLKKSLKPRHNQVAERYARLEAGHRLIQASFAQMRRVRPIVHAAEERDGFCLWISPWWPNQE